MQREEMPSGLRNGPYSGIDLRLNNLSERWGVAHHDSLLLRRFAGGGLFREGGVVVVDAVAVKYGSPGATVGDEIALVWIEPPQNFWKYSLMVAAHFPSSFSQSAIPYLSSR